MRICLPHLTVYKCTQFCLYAFRALPQFLPPQHLPSFHTPAHQTSATYFLQNIPPISMESDWRITSNIDLRTKVIQYIQSKLHRLNPSIPDHSLRTNALHFEANTYARAPTKQVYLKSISDNIEKLAQAITTTNAAQKCRQEATIPSQSPLPSQAQPQSSMKPALTSPQIPAQLPVSPSLVAAPTNHHAPVMLPATLQPPTSHLAHSTAPTSRQLLSNRPVLDSQGSDFPRVGFPF